MSETVLVIHSITNIALFSHVTLAIFFMLKSYFKVIRSTTEWVHFIYILLVWTK